MDKPAHSRSPPHTTPGAALKKLAHACSHPDFLTENLLLQTGREERGHDANLVCVLLCVSRALGACLYHGTGCTCAFFVSAVSRRLMNGSCMRGGTREPIQEPVLPRISAPSIGLVGLSFLSIICCTLLRTPAPAAPDPVHRNQGNLHGQDKHDD